MLCAELSLDTAHSSNNNGSVGCGELAGDSLQPQETAKVDPKGTSVASGRSETGVAAALAFLGTVAKDFSAVHAAVTLMRQVRHALLFQRTVVRIASFFSWFPKFRCMGSTHTSIG